MSYPFSRGINSETCNMASSDSEIDKPQRGSPTRAELPDVNINTDVQSINTERDSLTAKLRIHRCRVLPAEYMKF